jgi:hypothetical protein
MDHTNKPDPKLVALRRKALLELREMAQARAQRISIEEIKSWIEEGQR